MISKEQLIEAFARNVGIVGMQTNGLSHADSVLQLPFRGNCLNWVIGHMVGGRSTIIKALGGEGVLTAAQSARYGHGSEPVTGDGEDVMRLEDLLAKLELSQERLAAVLRAATPEALAKEVRFAGRSMTVGGRVFFLYYHDTYHTGQTEQLRQLAGTNDHII